jgi:hypothetical protein
MSLPPELRTALRNLRKVRSEKPLGEYDPKAYAAWRERIADALDLLATVLIHEEDRKRARAESHAARGEAARIRAGLDGSS